MVYLPTFAINHKQSTIHVGKNTPSMDGHESVGLCPFRVVLTDAQTLCQLKTLGGGDLVKDWPMVVTAMGTYVSFIF